MVELAATLFVLIVAFNFVVGFINGAGGVENALLIVFGVLGLLVLGLVVLLNWQNGLGPTIILSGLVLWLMRSGYVNHRHDQKTIWPKVFDGLSKLRQALNS